MPQPAASADRRTSPRIPTAFVFRLAGEGVDTAAWMVNQSEGGAAFLCPAERIPRLDSTVDLCAIEGDVNAPADARRLLPQVARVLRISKDGATREVAVRFLAPDDAGLRRFAGSGAVCRKSAPADRISPPIGPSMTTGMSAAGTTHS